MSGIICEKCGSESSIVIDSRKQGGVIMRRRECVDCGDKYTTHEVLLTDLQEQHKSVALKMLEIGFRRDVVAILFGISKTKLEKMIHQHLHDD